MFGKIRVGVLCPQAPLRKKICMGYLCFCCCCCFNLLQLQLLNYYRSHEVETYFTSFFIENHSIILLMNLRRRRQTGDRNTSRQWPNFTTIGKILKYLKKISKLHFSKYLWKNACLLYTSDAADE